jgi:hypothetical protein
MWLETLTVREHVLVYEQMTHEELEALISAHDVDVIDPSGKVLYFSVESFIKNIAGGNLCFICGADPSDSAPVRLDHQMYI